MKKTLLVALCATIAPFLFSQEKDTVSTKADKTNNELRLSGAVTVTNKGISTIPNLTLGKPAATFELSVGKGRLSFDPQFRFDLTNARPWSFLLWWRYRVVQNEKLRLTVGAHPAYSFKTIQVVENGVSKEIASVKRYLAGEVSTNYFITKNVSVGPYYLYSRGIDKDMTKNTHYLALTAGFNNIKIVDEISLRISPQVYYLNMDGNDGFYATSVFALSKKNFPVSLSALFNKEISSDVPGSKDFLWNVSLTYAFGSTYIKK